MRRSIALAAGLGLVVILAGCGGSSGPACEDVCAKVVSCNAEESLPDCLNTCADMKEVIRSNVYSAMGDCYLETDCATLEQDGEMCLVLAMAQAPSGASDGVLESMCARQIECTGTTEVTVAQCVAQAKTEIGDQLAMMNMFQDSVLDCLGSCVADTECTALENAMDVCMPQCGLDVFSDDE